MGRAVWAGPQMAASQNGGFCKGMTTGTKTRIGMADLE
jgi:hypothetical protein